VVVCAVIIYSEILIIFFLIYLVFVDNAGVIVNPKGEMKGTLQILLLLLYNYPFLNWFQLFSLMRNSARISL
jgi:hypothetical protein